MTSDSNQQTSVHFQHSTNLSGLLDQLGISLLISTYQAGKTFTVGSCQEKLQIRFHHFDHAMGLARTKDGLAIGTRREIWFLDAALSLSAKISPPGTYDACFLTKGCHYTGPIMSHEMACADGELWIVNTLFSCLCVINPGTHFEPRWKPTFISGLAPEDRCHLNGLGIKNGKPEFVTALGQSNSPRGWREKKANGGVLIHIPSNELICNQLCMPHSPRWHTGKLWVLNSGHGTLCTVDQNSGKLTEVISLPGYTRGLDFYGKYAFVGLARIRETAVFGSVPIAKHRDDLKCGLAIVNLESGRLEATLFFQNGVEEIFEVKTLPGFRNPILGGPRPDSDELDPIWITEPSGL